MNTTAATAPSERNGVPTDKLFATIAELKEHGDLAAFRFSARNQWIEGTASRSTIYEWHGAGADHVHVDEFTFAADHPTLGHGHGPTPQEYVLHTLAACITAGIATGAAARKIDLTSVSSNVTGEIDVRGVLGIGADIRRGFSSISIQFDVQGDADRSVLDGLLAGATDYSAVYDMLTAATPVTVTSVNS